MMNLLLVAAGGALGAASRYGVATAAMRHLGPGWPWGTFGVNVLGSLLIGVITGWLAFRVDGGGAWRLFMATGFLGGFTTFSAFSLETVAMLERKEFTTAVGYALGSVLLGVAAVFIGLWLARKIFA